MTVLVIFQFTVSDPAKAAAYSEAALPILAASGGTPVIIGQLRDLHERSGFDHGAVFSFPDRIAAETWYRSPDYQALLPLRAGRDALFRSARRLTGHQRATSR